MRGIGVKGEGRIEVYGVGRVGKASRCVGRYVV